MKFVAMSIIAVLLFAPAVLAVAQSYQKIYPQKKYERPTGPSVPTGFKGLQGIIGVSVEESERQYGPQKPFGKPKSKRLKEQARLPEGYRGLGGIAGEGITTSKGACEEFGCKPSHTVVGDKGTKMYYRCRCPAAKSIVQNNIQCLDSPGLAERLDYQRGGTC